MARAGLLLGLRWYGRHEGQASQQVRTLLVEPIKILVPGPVRAIPRLRTTREVPDCRLRVVAARIAHHHVLALIVVALRHQHDATAGSMVQSALVRRAA